MPPPSIRAIANPAQQSSTMLGPPRFLDLGRSGLPSGDGAGLGKLFPFGNEVGWARLAWLGSANGLWDGVFIGPDSTGVERHQLQIAIELHAIGEIVDPDTIQRILGLVQRTNTVQ